MADDHQVPGGATQWKHRVSRASLAETRVAALDGVVLAIASVVSYLLVTKILSRVYSPSRTDDLIGALWAVIATVFVFRDSYQHSVSAAVSRIAGTAVSLVLCLAYLAFLPFLAGPRAEENR